MQTYKEEDIDMFHAALPWSDTLSIKKFMTNQPN